MPEERRQNDKLILERLGELNQTIGKLESAASDMKVDLALNTQETTRLAEYQKTQNGKVIAHETRLQAIEGANALTATALAEIKESNKKKSDARSVALSRAGWAIAGGALVLVGRILTYLIQNDFIKQIIK